MMSHSKRRQAWLPTLAFLATTILAVGAGTSTVHAQTPLDPMTLTKFMDPLVVPPVMQPTSPGGTYYEIGMYQINQQLHSQLPPTAVWGYGTSAATANFPAFTIEAVRDVPIEVKWINNLPMDHLLGYAIDYTLHMVGYHNGMPTGEWTEGVPTVVHVHGGEVPGGSDGGPDAWFTQNWAEKGPAWESGNIHEVYSYPNEQLPATLWYHDHVLGITRLNVYAGLAGFYLLRDPDIEAPLNLPSGAYEIPIVIQDRMFFTDGQLMYPVGGDNPDVHPLWQPEFFGNTIVVNGVVWPYLEVEPRKYRFRMLNGSNARFYALEIMDDITNMRGPGFWQIGSDGGYMDAPVLLADPNDMNSPRMVMAPGERCDVIVDFSGCTPGQTFTMRNNAKSPYPNGGNVDPLTTGQIMQFRVVASTGPDNSSIATPGPGYVEQLSGATNTRLLTLDEVMGANGPLRAMLNGTAWDEEVTELPTLGSTEVWRIVNTTGDAHPIHLHLTQFQLVSRQKFNTKKYAKVYDGTGPAPDVTPYLVGKPSPAPAEEAGWKDTFKMFPGEVTTVIVRFAPQDGDATFGFDATAEPGYVWHCHILEHEDNEMMRPYKLVAPSVAQASAAAAPAKSEPEVGGVARIELESIRPNPATGPVEIRFALPAAGSVDLRVYDLQGREVRVLAAREFAAGRNAVTWDGRDDAGHRVPKGIYLYRLQAGSAVLTKRVAVL